MRPHGAQPEKVVQPHPRPDGRAPGHQHLAARPQQSIRDHKVFGGVGKDLKPVLAQDAGGLDQTEDIGLQRVLLADDLELDPARVEHLAGHMGGGDGLFHAVTSGGVGQYMDV